MPNVLSPRDLVFRPDNMDGTVPHTYKTPKENILCYVSCVTYCPVFETKARINALIPFDAISHSKSIDLQQSHI